MPKQRVKKRPHHRASLQVRKDDTVHILTGADKGQRGRVLEALPRVGKVRVDGIQMIWRHQRPRGRQSAMEQQRGRVQMPALIDAARVMLVCPSCDRPIRPRHVRNDRGEKVRACRHCRALIDEPRLEQQG